MLQVTNALTRKKFVLPETPSGASRANVALLQSALQSVVTFGYSTSAYIPVAYLPSMAEIRQLARAALWDTMLQIYELLSWDEGWNGYDACAPEYDAVTYADNWITQMFLEVVTSGNEWIRPNVTASEEGEVVFEWWRDTRKLTIYIGNQSAEYVKVWGTDINSEMSDGNADAVNTCRSLWEWLVD